MEGDETSMYGTVMRAKATPGNRQTVVAMMGEGVDTDGFHATHVLLPDGDDRTVVAAIQFQDPTTYSANSHDPATPGGVVQAVPGPPRRRPRVDRWRVDLLRRWPSGHQLNPGGRGWHFACARNRSLSFTSR